MYKYYLINKNIIYPILTLSPLVESISFLYSIEYNHLLDNDLYSIINRYFDRIKYQHTYQEEVTPELYILIFGMIILTLITELIFTTNFIKGKRKKTKPTDYFL